MTTLTAVVQTQQNDIERFKQQWKMRARRLDQLEQLQTTASYAESKEEHKVKKEPEEEKKSSKKHFNESSSIFESDDKAIDKPSNNTVRTQRENLWILVSVLPFHLNVSDSRWISASSMSGWVKKRSVSGYMHNIALCCGDADRNRFDAEFWAWTICLDINEKWWKTTVTKELMESIRLFITAVWNPSGFHLGEGSLTDTRRRSRMRD